MHSDHSACEAHIANLKRQLAEAHSPCMGCAVLRAERDRAVETRENANAVSLRVEAERDRAVRETELLRQWIDAFGRDTACIDVDAVLAASRARVPRSSRAFDEGDVDLTRQVKRASDEHRNDKVLPGDPGENNIGITAQEGNDG